MTIIFSDRLDMHIFRAVDSTLHNRFHMSAERSDKNIEPNDKSNEYANVALCICNVKWV